MQTAWGLGPREFRKPPGIASKQAGQFLAAETRIANDRSEGSPLQFAMQRHHEREIPVGVLETNVAATLADWFSADFGQGVHTLCA